MFSDRKAHSLGEPRKKLPWPAGKDFKILSIDGGGIRGIFPAIFLEETEHNLGSIQSHFDMIAGTSTGGIIAIGLGLGIKTDVISELYYAHGRDVFPPHWYDRKLARFLRRLIGPSHNHAALEEALKNTFEERLFGESESRLVIPAFVGPDPQITVFKTDHHPDYRRDWKSRAWEVARATSAAPTFFAGHPSGDAFFLDGGVWANNPIMCAIVEAISAYDITPAQIKVLSLGTGNITERLKEGTLRAGMIGWRRIINTAMYLTTDCALSQAQLILGHDHILRVEPPSDVGSIELDDWQTASDVLPRHARAMASELQDKIEPFFEAQVATRERFYSPSALS